MVIMKGDERRAAPTRQQAQRTPALAIINITPLLRGLIIRRYYTVLLSLILKMPGNNPFVRSEYLLITPSLTLLCSYFSSHLPCCALIFFRTYPAVPLSCFASTLLCAIFFRHLPCCAVIFFGAHLLCCAIILLFAYPAVP